MPDVFLRPGEANPNDVRLRDPWVVWCYSLQALAYGPVGYWRLGEPSGTNANDESANNLDGTINGSPTLGVAGALSGDTNTAFQFSGAATDYVLVADAAPLDMGNAPWTVTLWARWTAGVAGYMVSKGDQFQVRVTGNQVGIGNDAVGLLFTSAGPQTTDGLYHHWAVVRRATGSGGTDIYKDGQLQPLTENNPNLTFTSDAVDLNFGRYSGGGVGFTGALDEIAIYNVALTSPQILTLWGSAVVSCGGSSLSRTLTEAVASVDAWVRQAGFIRTMTETVASADVWTRSGGFVRTMVEAVAQADAWAASKLVVRTLTEAVTSSDVWTRTGTFIRTLTEAVASADAWIRSGSFVRSLTEAVAQADAWTRTGTFIRSMTDAVAQADAWTGVKIVLRSMTEAVTSSDAWTRSAGFVRTMSDAVGQADAWTRSVSFVRALGESVTSTDAWTRVATFRRAMAEAVTQLDAWVAAIGALPGIGAIGRIPGGLVRIFRSGGRAKDPSPGGSIEDD